jgi:hypothetical protein
MYRFTEESVFDLARNPTRQEAGREQSRTWEKAA